MENNEEKTEREKINKKIREIFSKNLNRIRINKKMTQEQLAEKAKVSVTIISNYECGNKTPSLAYAHSIANALGTTVDNLCGEDSETFYIKNAEKNPIVALLYVIEKFRFHTHLTPEGEIVLSLAHDSHDYFPIGIKDFFSEYETIQELIEKNRNNDSCEEMKDSLLKILKKKYSHLPDFPIYKPEK